MKIKYITNMLIKKEVEKFIDIMLQNNIKVDKVILFGSYAKGNTHVYSDIDLAVISSDFGMDELEEMMMLSKLSWKVSDRIEAIPLTNDNLKLKYHSLIGEIKKYGKVIYSSN
jgi:predicted nucleotidyltransferase